MKGYLNGNGYMGLVNGRYILFASEAEYEEYMAEEEWAMAVARIYKIIYWVIGIAAMLSMGMQAITW